MPSRIRKAYEARFRALLLRLHARKLEAGVAWLVGRARHRAVAESLPAARAASDLYEHLREQVRRWEWRAGRAVPRLNSGEPRFACDAGLGGLARWLRAAGYRALWFPDIEDAALLREARELDATVLTTDSLMMERGVLRDGVIPALWLPPALTKREQLGLVLREFNLDVRPPRCTRCGGELAAVPKESVRERIPPKTWRWIDEYFICRKCGHLFWKGTHWQRIQKVLLACGRVHQ